MRKLKVFALLTMVFGLSSCVGPQPKKIDNTIIIEI